MSKKTQREIELEALVMQRETELNDYRNRLSEASRAIAEYRNREASIVGALTEAHSSSKRMMDDAMVERDRILAEAQQNKTAMESEAQANLAQAQQTADGIISDAQAQAAAIVNSANEEATGIVNKAKAEYDACKKKLDALNEKITLTAEDASRKIEEFKNGFSFDAIEAEAIEFSTFESQPVFEQTAPTYVETAQNYFEEVAPSQTVQTEYIPEQPNYFEQAAPVFEETAPIEPVPSFFNDNLNTPVQTPEIPETQFFASAPSPFAEPMKEPVPIPKAYESEYYAAQNQNFYQSQNEAKVWTVEEVMGQAQPQQGTVPKESADLAFDAELDALINDVLNN